MKKILSVLFSLTIIMSVFSLPITSFAEPARISVHDPSITLAQNGNYYIVGSHLAMGKSDNLVEWQDMGSSINGQSYLSIDGKSWTENLAEPLEWTTSYQLTDIEKFGEASRYYGKDLEYNCWANDIIYNKDMGCYCLYGCCSVWGTTASVIWLATSDNIEGPYKYQKSFIYSGITDIDKNMPDYLGLYYGQSNIPEDLISTGLATENEIESMPWFTGRGFYDCGLGMYPNAIDPTAFTDKNGEMWLVYGSYSGGCYVIKLNNKTGTPDYEYMKQTEGFDIYFGKQISRTNEGSLGTGEGPYIIYDAQTGYYYFYLTYGGLDARGGYNIREYRSKYPDGPYYDAAGNLATDMKNTGLKLAGNYKFSCNDYAYMSPGHSSCLIDSDGSMYQVYHTRFDGKWSNNTEGHEVRVHKMLRTQDGWSVMLPFEYQGEADVSSFTASDVAGVYEFINSNNKSQSVEDWGASPNSDIILPSKLIYLNPNGRVEGVRNYKFDEHHTNLGYTSVSGTWKMVASTAYVNMTIGGVEYKGVFTKQYDESADKNYKIVFAAKGNDNTTIWGVKDNTHTTHTYTYAVTKKATCTENGIKTYTCKVCGRKYTQTVKATGHTVVIDKAVKPTYASSGKTEGKHCSVCKKVLVAQKTVARLTVPKSSISKITSRSKGFNLSWKKVSVASSYEIQYATNSKYSSAKKITVSKSSTSKTVTKLKPSKKYYVRIRAYKTYNGKRYYSAWSSTTVKTKK